MEIKVVAVDEDIKSLRNIERIGREIENVAEFMAFESPVRALDYITRNPKDVNVVFAEIEMNEINGIEFVDRVHQINEDIKAVFLTLSPQYALRAFEVDAIGYLLKPADPRQVQRQLSKAARFTAPPQKPRIFVRTFGHFDIFVDGVAVRFSSAKAKELLALLVDRRGGVVTMAQAIGTLWESRAYDDSVRSLYRNVLQSLRETLSQAGISEIFINSRNSRSVNTTKFECDYYQLLDGKNRGITSFNGEYMTDYPWGAATLETIRQKIDNR